MSLFLSPEPGLKVRHAGRLYEVDRAVGPNWTVAVDAETGAQRWSFALGPGGEQSSPAIVDGRVVFGAFDHNVYALDAITGGPAAMWGRDDLGRIAPGRTADLVVWTGDPLELMTLPVAVLIDGQRVSLENRQQALTDRYRDLTRGERPIAYED